MLLVRWQLGEQSHLDAGAFRQLVEIDRKDGETVGVKGTPTFFVNERPLTNFGPQQLYDLVLAELAATQ